MTDTVSKSQYETLEKVSDEMLMTLKAIASQLQQTQASQSQLIAQIGLYVNKIESEKNRPETQSSEQVGTVESVDNE